MHLDKQANRNLSKNVNHSSMLDCPSFLSVGLKKYRQFLLKIPADICLFMVDSQQFQGTARSLITAQRLTMAKVLRDLVLTDSSSCFVRVDTSIPLKFWT